MSLYNCRSHGWWVMIALLLEANSHHLLVVGQGFFRSVITSL